MSDKKSLVVSRGSNLSVIDPTDNAMQKIMLDIMMFHPQLLAVKKSLGIDEAKRVTMAYLNLALALRASPIPGTNELHILPDGRVTTGINYWERQSYQRGGVLWVQKPRAMNEQEREDHGVEVGDTAFIAAAMYRNDWPMVKEMIDTGFSRDEARESVATWASGIVRAGELKSKKGYDMNKKGRTTGWWAKKRLMKALFSIMFPFDPQLTQPGVGLMINDAGSTVIDGDSVEIKAIQSSVEGELIQKEGISDAWAVTKTGRMVGNGGQVVEAVTTGDDDGGQDTKPLSLYEQVLKHVPHITNPYKFNGVTKKFKNAGIPATFNNYQEYGELRATMSSDDVIEAMWREIR